MHRLYLAGAASNVGQGTDCFTLRRFVTLPVSPGKLWCCTSYHTVCKPLCTSLSIKHTACLNSWIRSASKKCLCDILTVSCPVISVYTDRAICNTTSSILTVSCPVIIVYTDTAICNTTSSILTVSSPMISVYTDTAICNTTSSVLTVSCPMISVYIYIPPYVTLQALYFSVRLFYDLQQRSYNFPIQPSMTGVLKKSASSKSRH
jgi:hypothetical protein